ncbi:DUF2842 domain-containing protein [Altererythrobacter sp. SALINAS58]|uniref:DUF2842 domain-containing protein n=1 Tax=Alteripontixanthobacter muriae TaxID=2705546 RepID=UPI001576B4F1|nr:DUF2842 domain-containing protein [Alteripontixanthobacter muriae]NTZ41539.1 DUF2842 domain-containing protein [Alteripontixanthobacter muriae]
MRGEPTWRLPVGILALLACLLIYALAVAWASDWISLLPVWVQTIVYLILGVIWLLPLRNFLIWMETGRWGEPPA